MRLRPVHKFLHKKLRIPQEALRPVLGGLRVLGRRAEQARRIALADEIQRASADARGIPRELGYLRFQPDDFPGIPEVVSRCRQVFEESRNAEPLFPRKAAFLQLAAHSEQLTSHREILGFMLSRPIVDIASRYLGAVPLLVNASILWSPVNDTARSSQLFHLDDEDNTMVQVFLNLWEVTPAHGPLTFLPAHASHRVQARTGRIIKRGTDERVLGAADGTNPVSICGPPGAGVLVDTARCLHYGSRENKKERLVLLFTFLRADAPSEPPTSISFPDDLAGLEPDPVQRLVLGLPEAEGVSS